MTLKLKSSPAPVPPLNCSANFCSSVDLPVPEGLRIVVKNTPVDLSLQIVTGLPSSVAYLMRNRELFLEMPGLRKTSPGAQWCFDKLDITSSTYCSPQELHAGKSGAGVSYTPMMPERRPGHWLSTHSTFAPLCYRVFPTTATHYFFRFRVREPRLTRRLDDADNPRPGAGGELAQLFGGKKNHGSTRNGDKEEFLPGNRMPWSPVRRYFSAEIGRSVLSLCVPGANPNAARPVQSRRRESNPRSAQGSTSTSTAGQHAPAWVEVVQASATFRTGNFQVTKR